ncbi:violacein biosynthesis enzyme VioE [Aquimarina sp. RZ0]|uniref:violacein biosynthesis enzyme VioE n=1 Tax=Aquimarina sp. RZ0 TaxID=2607730 RepID=UPI0011F0B0D6|nr:violacein biosynthesis enzyme VioE [Aquimarina sp. RZ0]KAA1247023.1 hypothetical protein F0000_04885 [Aquimarina sp. RZ0]
MNLPQLPDTWQAAYISLWKPMMPENFISNGMAWFDYDKGLYRIDGLSNPWDVKTTGYKLWLSEIGVQAEKKKQKKTINIYPDKLVENLENHVYEGKHPLPQNVLSLWNASHIGQTEIEEQSVDIWESESQDKKLYISSVTHVPLKMELKKNEQTHVKKFISPLIGEIQETIFKLRK